MFADGEIVSDDDLRYLSPLMRQIRLLPYRRLRFQLMGKVTACHFTHKLASAWKTNLPP
jgi:hypothetical protein